MSTATACPVCCESFTSRLRKRIECLHCHYEACCTCIKQYLLHAQDPQCMNCHTGWNAEFLDAQFPETFRKGSYKKHMESVLLDREKAWMPGTMVHVQARREEQQRQADITLMQGEIQRLRQRVMELQLGRPPPQRGAREDAPQNRVACRCPAADCRGFVLERDWSCGVCSARVCATCMDPLLEGEGGHTCKPENVETAKLLRRDSRACPKCAILIFRISGCNQMWCTSCNTAFDWRTGEIESRLDRVHNPHYFEWLRRSQVATHAGQPAAGGGGCAGAQNIPPPYSFSQYLARHMPLTSPLAVRMMNAHRMILHIQHVLLPRLRNRTHLATVPPENVNLDLRIQYMSNEMTENAFQTAIYKRAVLNEKTNVQRQLMQMFTQCAIDIMRQAMATPSDGTPTTAFEALEELRRFYNDGVLNYRKRFHTKQCIRVNEHWEECK